jgi:DNA polymerase-3 subunit delta'
MIAAGFQTVGQPTARAIAERAVRDGRIGQTLLVHGPAGSGKRLFVEDLAALVLCDADPPAERPCNACRACRLARSGTHPDVAFGSPERWRAGRAGEESIVAAARRWVLDVAGAPVAGPLRIAIIEDADGCSEQIQNALLKALEEPSPRHLFVLVADDPSRLLPTIRSRSQPLRLGAVPHAELTAWLMDRHGLPADQAAPIARMAGGRVGQAATYATQPDLVAWRLGVQRRLLAALASGRAERFGLARDLLDDAAQLIGRGQGGVAVEPLEDEPGGPRRSVGEQRAGAAAILSAWIDLGRDLALAAAGRDGLTSGRDVLEDLAAAATAIGAEAATRAVRRLAAIRDALEENASPRLALEVAMLDWPTSPSAC